MSKLTVHDAPEAEAGAPEAPTASQAMTRTAMKPEVLTDTRGRKIAIRPPEPTAQFMIALSVGPEAATNPAFMQMINPLIYVGGIDSEPVFLPGTLDEVMALISRLGDEGLEAVMSWYMANVIQPTVDAIEAAKKAEREKAAIKN